MNASSINAPGYVVETPACDDKGVRIGTMRHYVGTEARAREEAAKVAERTWREVPLSAMPADVRDKLIAARQQT